MQYRDVTELRVEADCEEEPGPIKTFKIERRQFRECRRRDSERWQYDSTPNPEWRVGNGDGGMQSAAIKFDYIATGITRDQLAKLIADAADILAYTERG
jgi:hypothetical protein